MKNLKTLVNAKKLDKKEQQSIKGGSLTPFKCFPGMTCPPGTICINYTCELFTEDL